MIFRSSYSDVVIPNISLPKFLLDRTKSFANKAALIDGPSGRSYTYAQLAGAVKIVASSLAKKGFKKGDVFAIFAPNIPEYAIIFNAVALLGGINTTANPLYTNEELNHQLKDSGAKYLISIPLFLDKAKEAAKETDVKEIFVFGEVEGATPFTTLMQGDGNVPEVEIDPKKDLVVLPYSSGTTGFPKGVMLTHHNIVSNICQIEGMDDLELVTEKDVGIGVLPFFHIYGMVVILNMALSKGATIVTMPRFDLEQFLKLIQDYKITRANVVPPMALALAKHPLVDKYDLSSLELIMSGAAPLGKELSQACGKRVGCVVLQGYGLTETSPVATASPSQPSRIRDGSVGVVIPNSEIQIVDPNTNKAVGPNEDGEIWIRGPHIMQGYLNNPQATAITIDKDGWLHSGDIGHINDDGYLFITDRLKELIKYKGFQVPPAELEAVLLTHPAIADAAVIPIPDEEAGELPKAYVVLREDISPQEIMDFVAEHVSPQKKVRLVEITDQIPKSLSGKILRRVLVEQERAKNS